MLIYDATNPANALNMDFHKSYIFEDDVDDMDRVFLRLHLV